MSQTIQDYRDGLTYVGKCNNTTCPIPTKFHKGFGQFYPKKDSYKCKCFQCGEKFNLLGFVFIGASSVIVNLYDEKNKIINEFDNTKPSSEFELKKEIRDCKTISIQVNEAINALQKIPRIFALTPNGETELGTIFPECQVCYCSDPTPLVLACGHYICQSCATSQLKLQPMGGGKKFTTNYSQCGFCRSWLSHPSIKDIVDRVLAIFEQRNRIMIQADIISTDEKLLLQQNPLNPDYPFLNDHIFFFCYECNRLYYGGEKNCGVNYEGGNPAERVCAPCSIIKISGKISHCNVHGSEFISFKCRYCCNIASWFCFGTTHFCEPCHNSLTYQVKPCTCGKPHGPNGQEHVLGCVLCNSEAYKYV